MCCRCRCEVMDTNEPRPKPSYTIHLACLVLLGTGSATGWLSSDSQPRKAPAGMSPPPLVSPVTGSSVASEPHYLHSDDATGFFRDIHGRTLFLRGINLASSAKTPVGQPGHKLQGFWEGAESGNVSFVNRVLDLDIDSNDEASADTHLRRLRSWGFNSLRYVVTWESLEHDGP